MLPVIFESNFDSDMYNGHEYLSCIKIPAAKQAVTKNAHRMPEKMEPMDFTTDRRNLISAANKVFGENKWSFIVDSQTLDFIDTIDIADKTNARTKYCVGCVSFVKVQLENGNFHGDIGYHVAEESTKGLSIQNARIGSTVNALKRVLLSFGDKIERELQQLQKQINPEQTNKVQRDVAQPLNKVSEKTKLKTLYAEVLLSTQRLTELNEVHKEFNDTNVQVDEFVSHPLKTEREDEPNKNLNSSITDPTLAVNKNNSTTEANPLSSVKVENAMIDEPSNPSNKIKSTNAQELKSALSKNEILRMERKRKQMEKQLEFKKRMMEREGSISDNKPNPRY